MQGAKLPQHEYIFFLTLDFTKNKISQLSKKNSRRQGRFLKQVLGISFIIILSLSILSIAPASSFGVSVQYFYDDIGRLIATVSDTGDVTIYIYDEVGNLLSISKDTFSPNPPVIQSINPDILFIGTATLVSITGQNLLTMR